MTFHSSLILLQLPKVNFSECSSLARDLLPCSDYFCYKVFCVIYLLSIQMCTKVQQLLRSGKLGDCSEAVKLYEHSCHRLFPLATTFREETPKEVPNEQLSENPPEGQDDIKDECSGGQGN